MRTQQSTQQDSTTTITPKIQPTMCWRVAQVVPMPGFKLAVTFLDGLIGEVDMNDFVHCQCAGVFSALSDLSCFDAVFVEHGAVTWPGEIDLAPDAMYKEIKKNGFWKLI